MLIFGLALALLLEAPLELPRVQLRPEAGAPQQVRVISERRAAGDCRAATSQNAGLPRSLYVPEVETVRPKRMTRLPDANMVRTVLRTVDGQCEVVVVAYGVSTPPAADPHDVVVQSIPAR